MVLVSASEKKPVMKRIESTDDMLSENASRRKEEKMKR
jgi:hypothetical protein